jgi:hypothetical protein
VIRSGPDHQSTAAKNKSHDNNLRYSLNDDAVAKAKNQASGFLHRIEKHLSTSTTKWILNTPSATALDAHCVPFIRRLIEADNAGIVPLEVQRYAKRAVTEPEWESITEGKPTLWNVYLRDHLIPLMQRKKMESDSA